ncbi:MAG: hypothetical protein IKL09_08825 [Clostridia bacterium]|nr:hypothetical protein [Clostridia bacterium]
MPRKLVVSRTLQVIDVTYTYYDKSLKNTVSAAERINDRRMSEGLIIKRIESIYPERKVISVDKIETKVINFKMPADQFIKIANAEERK